MSSSLPAASLRSSVWKEVRQVDDHRTLPARTSLTCAASTKRGKKAIGSDETTCPAEHITAWVRVQTHTQFVMASTPRLDARLRWRHLRLHRRERRLRTGFELPVLGRRRTSLAVRPGLECGGGEDTGNCKSGSNLSVLHWASASRLQACARFCFPRRDTTMTGSKAHHLFAGRH